MRIKLSRKRAQLAVCLLVVIYIAGYLLTLLIHDLRKSADVELKSLKRTIYSADINSRLEIPSNDAETLMQRVGNTIPNSVYVQWCGSNRSFEFRHYLSLLSIVRYLEPDNIVMFYNSDLPVVDPFHYYTWFAEFETMFPFFRKQHSTRACNGTHLVEETIRRDGGIYVGENVVLARSPADYMSHKSFAATGNGTSDVVLRMLSGGYPGRLNAAANVDVVVQCQRVQDASGDLRNNAVCLVLENAVNPKDIWEADGDVGQLLRTVAYGKPDAASPVPDYNRLVPKIGHLVWIGGGGIFLDVALAILSLLHVAKVDAVYIHGQAPSGFYWDLIKNDTRIKVIHRTFGGHVFGGNRIGRRMHVADVIRADILHKYGGIYIDADAVFVRPLSAELYAYDAVASVDITASFGTAYPDTIQNGVMIAKPGAKFFRLHLEAMKDFYPDDFFWIGIRSSYKVKERHPTLLLLEPRLQLLCYDADIKCRPTWFPDYLNQTLSYLTSDKVNWTTDFNVLHVPHPRPYAFLNHKQLLDAPGLFGDVGRFVARESGMLELFKSLPLPKNLFPKPV